MIKLSKIKPNPNNPRLVKDDKFFKLVESIKEFGEKMMPLRPMVIDENNILLGGNMRYKALKELGYKEVPDNWVKQANDLTEEEKRQFIIKDNVGFGAWDWDILANAWDGKELEDWGLDIPNFDAMEDVDYSDKNKEIDIDSFEDEMTIKLKYSSAEFELVKNALLKIAASPEQAVWSLLKLKEIEAIF